MTPSIFAPTSPLSAPHWSPEALADAMPRRAQPPVALARLDLTRFAFSPPANAMRHHRPRRPVTYAPASTPTAFFRVGG